MGLESREHERHTGAKSIKLGASVGAAAGIACNWLVAIALFLYELFVRQDGVALQMFAFFAFPAAGIGAVVGGFAGFALASLYVLLGCERHAQLITPTLLVLPVVAAVIAQVSEGQLTKLQSLNAGLGSIALMLLGYGSGLLFQRAMVTGSVRTALGREGAREARRPAIQK